MDHSQTGRHNHTSVTNVTARLFIGAALCLLAGRLCAQTDAGTAGPVAQTAPFPQADITNGLVRVRLYLPDTAIGYYRGTRFDWSGVMPALEYNGHAYSGQWFKTYAPTIHDAVMGPVESFSPLGYDAAAPGGRFVAIGIGALTRVDAGPYVPFRYYPIADAGRWQVNAGRDKVIFVQTLSDSGYAYTYTKTVRLVKGKAEMRLEHALRNTGQKLLETDVYDHNLLPVDHQPVGPGWEITFPFRLSATEARRVRTGGAPGAGASTGGASGAKAASADSRGPIAALAGNRIVFLRRPADKEDAYCVLSGFGNSPRDYDIRVDNRRTGAGMRITCDSPLSRLVFWASPATACPEAYIHVRVRPGETVHWTIVYQFYEVPTLTNEP